MRLLLTLGLGAALGLSACSSVAETITPQKQIAPVELATNIAEKATDITVDTVVTASATNGKLTTATLYAGDDPTKNVIDGRVSGANWIASELLEPSQTYHLEVKGSSTSGEPRTLKRTFTTQQLTLDQQTYPSVIPLQGETVGIGMPVIVKFDLPVENRAVFERKLQIVSTPAVEGSWNWLSDREVHYRPKEFWPAGAKVTLVAALNGLNAGNGIYGQQDQVIDFTIGRSVISTVDLDAHQVQVAIDGKVARTIPISAGDSSHQTREGTKIIMEKFASVDMDAATTGVDSEDPDYYNISDVRWAMRVTNSGEFLHAAPWSAPSHGRANVSHGCVGMSTANAKWLFDRSRRGDVVKFVNSNRGLEQGNGWTDWNVSFKQFAKGSAL